MELKTDLQFETLETVTNNNFMDVQQCVEDIIKREGYVSYIIKKKIFTPDSGSFLGILCEIDIEGERRNGETTEKKETNIFTKIIIPDSQMTIFSLPEAYKNELYVYVELSKIFSELQNEVDLPTEDKFKFVKSYDGSNQNVIVLENMIKKDFKTNFRMDVITLNYAEKAIGELAKFHALSFALESKRPKYYEHKIKSIKATFSYDKDWNAFVQNMCEITLNYLEEDSRRKLEDFIFSFNEKYRGYVEGRNAKLCLRHGDYRPSNILVKETNGKITEMIPIDYQLIYYGCPVLDLIYFIFSSTDQAFRRCHLLHLKDLYHENLRRFLKHFSLDIKNVYPRDDFERDYKSMLDYGLMTSLLLIPLIMSSENDVDIARKPVAGLNLDVVDQCRERLVGIVQDFIEWGYL